jgi:hypothetical protein
MSFVRNVLSIIPRSMFLILNKIIEIQTSQLNELPTRVEKERLKEYVLQHTTDAINVLELHADSSSLCVSLGFGLDCIATLEGSHNSTSVTNWHALLMPFRSSPKVFLLWKAPWSE